MMPAPEIDPTEWQINDLAYELYGLTEEEIRIVEGVENLPKLGIIIKLQI